MNKSDLINTISKDTGLSKSDSIKAMNSILHYFKKQLEEGNEIHLSNFDTFIAAEKKPKKRKRSAVETIKSFLFKTLAFYSR